MELRFSVAVTLIGTSYIAVVALRELIAILLATPKYQKVQDKGLGMTWGGPKWMTIACVGGMILPLILWMYGGLG